MSGIQTSPPKTEFFFSAPTGEEMVIVYLVENRSNIDKEIIYDLTTEVGLGGIRATIDYDGSFGPKSPEPYHWEKVLIAAGGKQYLIVTFPLPAGYTPEMKITPSVKLHLGPRG
ncbi:MAG: hypothetical protein Q7R84_00600 [bacterium]|nr:hypothetical protein [bacterium]